MSIVNELLTNIEEEEEDSQWEKTRCPNCNALLFEKDSTFFILESIRIKCRLCKNIIVV